MHTHSHSYTHTAATESQTIIRECLFFSIPPVFPLLPNSVSVNVLSSYYPYPSHTRMPKQHWRGEKRTENWGGGEGGGGCKQVRIAWYRSQRKRSVRWESEGCEEDMQRGEKLLCSGCPWDSWNRHNKTFFQREREAVSVCMSEGERVGGREGERRRGRHQALICLAYWTGSSGRDIVETLYVFTLHRHLFSSPVQLHQWTVTNCELVHQSDAHRLYDVIRRL